MTSFWIGFYVPLLYACEGERKQGLLALKFERDDSKIITGNLEPLIPLDGHKQYINGTTKVIDYSKWWFSWRVYPLVLCPC